ncbi:MAG: PilN domain-containing protein [Bdellovibrionota bacterium]
MIKVNLLKNRGTVSEASTQFDYTNISGTPDSGADSSASSSPLAILAKVLIIFSLSVLLYIYESYNIGVLTEQNAAVQARVQELQAEITKNESIIGRATEMQSEIKQIEERINVIKKMSKIRLREIKAIDYLQNTMPDRVWFQTLDFKDKSFRVMGYAATDESLNRFIDTIDGKSFFRTAILLNNDDFKTKGGSVKKFIISTDLIETD